MKYKKKPIVVEAVQWNGLNLEEIKDFVGDSLIYNINDAAWKVGKDAPTVHIKIKTLEGTMIAKTGDYIIRGVNGEIYPCKAEVFWRSYEEVS